MNKYKSTLLTASVAALLMSASASSAAIALLDSGGVAKTQTSASTITVTSTDLGTFDANGASKLVVTVSGERGGAGSYAHAGVTYGDVEMTLILGSATDNTARYISMWYLDNVTVTGDFVVDFGGNGSGVGFGAVALSGTKAGGAADSSFSLGTSTSITTTTASEFLMAAGMANGTTAPTASSPLTQLFSGDTGSSSGAAGHRFVTSASTVTPTFTGANGVIAASFEAIPEPSAALLGAIGFLVLLRRRR